MKFYVEISLIVLLVMLMYLNSQSLNRFSKSILGKTTLVISVLLITAKFGRNAGVLAAVIFVLLLHTSYEGIDEEEEEMNDEDLPLDEEEEEGFETMQNITDNQRKLAEGSEYATLQASAE